MPVDATLTERTYRGRVVDLLAIARREGVRVIAFDGEEDGVYLVDRDAGPVIGIRRGLPLPWRRYVLAHELGHHATGDRLTIRIVHFRRNGGQAWDSAEGPAERWALETLMPTAALVPLLLEEPTDEEIAGRFVVPVEAVRRRVQLLEHRPALLPPPLRRPVAIDAAAPLEARRRTLAAYRSRCGVGG